MVMPQLPRRTTLAYQSFLLPPVDGANVSRYLEGIPGWMNVITGLLILGHPERLMSYIFV